MTSPQEFTRLCNAILRADHGDDFLPIDDDRPDRGNDGYLKSQKRIFAGHCFKRIQNQSIDQAIKAKMVGDLGKAMTLKEQGIWDIEAWTFLSNYPIPEEIGQQLVDLGAKAGMDVSWRGPAQLAEGLQRHEELLEQFPGLNATQINSKLDAMQEKLDELAPDAKTSADGDFDPDQLPVTPNAQQRIGDARPPGWEFLLYAGCLVEGKLALERKWDDEQLGVSRGERVRVSEDDALSFLRGEMNVMRAIIGDLMQGFEGDAQERAFGAEGEPGDSARIENLAHQVVRAYEDLMDWAAALRGAAPAAEFEDAFAITAKMAHLPIEQLRDFIDDAARETLKIPQHAKSGSEDTLTIRVTVTLSIDDALVEAFGAELERIANERA